MNAKIFSFTKISQNSIIASARIAKFIANTLELPLCWDATVGDDLADKLIIIGGAFAFSGKDVLAALGAAIEHADSVVWVQNDFTVIPPKDESGAESPFRKAFRNRRDQGKRPIDYWTTVEPMSRPGKAASGHIVGLGSKYVNWNVLTFEPNLPSMPMDQRPFSEYMIYYGSYRKDRERYFERYLKAPPIKTVISCPTSKFFDNGFHGHDNIAHWDRVSDDLHGFLGKFGMGLYLEDKKSHSEYHSPANRFYEMLSARLPMVFQQEASKQLLKAEIDVDDFVAWNNDDIEHHFVHREDMLAAQTERWYDFCRGQRDVLPQLVKMIWQDYIQ